MQETYVDAYDNCCAYSKSKYESVTFASSTNASPYQVTFASTYKPSDETTDASTFSETN